MSEGFDRSKMYGIGASDVPTILGMNPFCTPLKLYSRLIGLIEPDEQTEPMYWGKKKEQIIAERFAEGHNAKLMAYKRRFVHKEMPFFSCELDRIIVGTEVNVECKSVNEHKVKDWSGDIDVMPDYIIVQTQAQMGLSLRKETWVACLIGASHYVEKLVKFDQDLYSEIESKVKAFWTMVESRTPPAAVIGDDDILLALHPTADEQIQLVQEMNDSIRLLQETKAQISTLEEQKESIEVKLKECINDNLGIKTSEYIVKWTPMKTSRVDIDRMKAEGIYEKFLKVTASRRMTVNKNKEVRDGNASNG